MTDQSNDDDNDDSTELELVDYDIGDKFEDIRDGSPQGVFEISGEKIDRFNEEILLIDGETKYGSMKVADFKTSLSMGGIKPIDNPPRELPIFNE
jgi:hypothetical protein